MLKFLIILSYIIASTEAPAIGWLAYGDLRGYLDPCGCDPDNDLGGLRRINKVVSRERLVDPQMLLFDLGNNLPTDQELVSSKSQFLFEGQLANAPTAVLVNELELNFEVLLAPSAMEYAYKLPWVLSNFKGQGKRPLRAQEFVVAGKHIVFGYTWFGAQKHQLLKAESNLLGSWRAKAQSKNKKSVLLFSGPDAHLKQIVDGGYFDIVVASNSAPMDANPSVAERNDESLLMRPAGVLMVPLGGQGILRGGAKRVEVAPSIFELNNATKKAHRLLAPEKLVTWLDKSEHDPAVLKDLFHRFANAHVQQFNDLVKKRQPQLTDSEFVGAQACKACHADAFSAWQGSAHAKAHGTLKQKSKDKDWECVSCHVVGAKDQGGFVSLELSPQLANVQCENCHGPRREHSLNPSLKPAVDPKAACQDCHHPPHSAAFDFETYWKKIRH